LRDIVRWISGLMILLGLLLIVYAGYNYAHASLAVSDAETHIPGQPTQVAGTEPTMPPSPPMNTATATGTNVPTSTQAPAPTQAGATEPPTAVRAPLPQGLPRGQGANPTRLVIPRLKLDTGIQEATWSVVDENGSASSEWQIPFNAVGHLSTTAKPGEAGNAVISGHHNLIGPNEFGLGKFAGLWNLKIGDPLYVLDARGRVFVYRVSDYYTLKELGEPLSVRVAHAQQILQDSDIPIATLETCWNGAEAPLSGNTFRWIVVATLTGTVDPTQVPHVSS
jgi:hypothetical protein